jgi:hypothetical protein
MLFSFQGSIRLYAGSGRLLHGGLQCEGEAVIVNAKQQLFKIGSLFGDTG